MSDETPVTETPAATPDPAPAAEPAKPAEAPAETPAAETPPGETPAADPEPAAASASDTPEVVKARKILAVASKRAERALARENAAKGLEARAKEYDDIRARVATDPLALIKLGGFASIRDYLRAVTDTSPVGGESTEAPTPEARRIAALEQRLQQADEQAKNEARAEAIEESQKKVFAAIDANPKYDRATGALGHNLLWQEIVEYHKIHGQCPDERIYQIAEKVEKYLADEGVAPRRKPKAPAAKPADEAPHAVSNGMTTTAKPNGLGDGDDEFGMDGKERMRKILARFGKPSAPVS